MRHTGTPPISIELADDFAVDTAEAIARWRRGEELALSIW